MSFKIIDTYEAGEYHDINVWECTKCGWSASIDSEGDCPCECPQCLGNECRDEHNRELVQEYEGGEIDE